MRFLGVCWLLLKTVTGGETNLGSVDRLGVNIYYDE